MSYGRRPYYILGGDNEETNFYGDERIGEGTKLQGKIDNDAIGQFIVSLLQFPQEFIQFLKKGLACSRYTHNAYRKEGVTDPGERPRRKVDVLDDLKTVVEFLQKEIKREYNRGVKKNV